MSMARKITLILAACGLLAAAGDPRPPIGYDALANLDRLWLYTGLVRTAMSSSSAPDLGNMDMSNFHGKFRGEPVLARIDGPGCVYRIWSAAPSGRIKVYLDGADKPELDCAFKPYLKGECAGLPADFAHGRFANYMPIPFARSIIITAPGFTFPGYYQVSYQTYPAGTKLASFRRSEAMSAPGREAAARVWREGALPHNRELQRESARQTLAPNAAADFIVLTGAGVIRSLALKNPANPADPLAGIRIHISFDGADKPQVNAPADAFFLNRFDLKADWPGGALANLFVAANAQGYQAFFPLPFAGGARLRLINLGAAPVELQADVGYEPQGTLPAGALRFHAEYRERDYDTDRSPGRTIGTHTAIDPATNYVVLDRAGAGHYLGTAIFVASVGTQWWGEGDEVTWVDGATEPPIRGTGTEDEFNWSWGFNPYLSPVSGTLPVIPECKETIVAQLIPSLRNPDCADIIGHNIAFRFRPTDYVAFSRSIKVSYEVLGSSMTPVNNAIAGNWSQWRGDDYASMAYWYEAPPGD